MEGGWFETRTNPPITPHLDIPSEAAGRGGTSRYGVPGGFGGFGFRASSRVAYLNKVLAGMGRIPEQGTSGYGDECEESVFPSVGRPPLVRGSC